MLNIWNKGKKPTLTVLVNMRTKGAMKPLSQECPGSILWMMLSYIDPGKHAFTVTALDGSNSRMCLVSARAYST